MTKQLIINTDRACSGNPGPGGFAAIILISKSRMTVTGGDPRTTNNREAKAPNQDSATDAEDLITETWETIQDPLSSMRRGMPWKTASSPETGLQKLRNLICTKNHFGASIFVHICSKFHFWCKGYLTLWFQPQYPPPRLPGPT